MLTQKGSGGSDISAKTAAEIWIQQIEPLAKQGVKLGAPACTGAETGRQWTQDFFTACGSCTIDFIPVHVRRNFCSSSNVEIELADFGICSGTAIFKGWQAISETMLACSTEPYG